MNNEIDPWKEFLKKVGKTLLLLFGMVLLAFSTYLDFMLQWEWIKAHWQVYAGVSIVMFSVYGFLWIVNRSNP